MKFYNREKEVAELKRVQELAFTQNSRMIVVQDVDALVKPVS